MNLRGAAAAAAALGAGLGAAWAALVAVQGNFELTWETDGTLEDLTSSGHSLTGRVVLANRGRQGGTVYRVTGRVVEGPGRVMVQRAGSRPHEPGWWVSNVLKPGESCVVEVTVEFDEDEGGDDERPPTVVELDAHELGRRLMVHRTVRLTVPAVPAML